MAKLNETMLKRMFPSQNLKFAILVDTYSTQNTSIDLLLAVDDTKAFLESNIHKTANQKDYTLFARATQNI